MEPRLQSLPWWSPRGHGAFGPLGYRHSDLLVVVLSLLIGYAAADAAGASREMDPALFRTPYMPYGVFDDLPTINISVGESRIILAYAPGELTLPKDQVTAWITRSAQAVAGYYARFPVAMLRLLVIPVEGRGVRSGTTYSYRGAATKILIGRDATLSELEEDWILVHELVHLAFPNVPRQHHWIEEGLATYVEPIVRAQAGLLPVERVWWWYLRGMPKGLPQDGDQGLDWTHTWGRTYWGGALFCLTADLRIRERTSNRYGLRDALQAILDAGGNMEQDWPLDRALAVGDRAIGVPVLTELYYETRATAVPVNLLELWQRLGVSIAQDTVTFDDAAPLAAMRRALTTRP